MSVIGDSSMPVYKFEYDDGTVRRTDDAIDADERRPAAVEALAEFGREDPECEVTLVGFE